MEANALLQFEKVPVCNCRQKWKQTHCCNSENCQKCLTAIKKWKQTHFCNFCGHKCINFGWVQRLSLLRILCARRHEKRTHQTKLVGKAIYFSKKRNFTGFAPNLLAVGIKPNAFKIFHPKISLTLACLCTFLPGGNFPLVLRSRTKMRRRCSALALPSKNN